MNFKWNYFYFFGNWGLYHLTLIYEFLILINNVIRCDQSFSSYSILNIPRSEKSKINLRNLLITNKTFLCFVISSSDK